MDAGWLSLIPPALAIVLAFAVRQVIPALFAGVVAGALVLYSVTGAPSDLNIVSRFLLPALGSSNFAQILLIYLWCLGGLVGLWDRTGGARHFAETVGARVAKGPRSSMFFAWLVGVLFHQGGTVSTVLAGTTVKPVTDRHRISHEELSYLVDSTASPVATVIPFNAWPLYIGGLVVGTIPLIPDDAAALDFFLASIPYNFYGIFAVLATLAFALGIMPWIGPRMAAARDRARSTGALDAPEAEPLMPQRDATPPEAVGYRPHIIDFAGPIAVLLLVAVVPWWLADNFMINEAFLSSVLAAMVIAGLRGMKLRDILEGFLNGCRQMTLGAMVLALAVTLKEVADAIGTADFVVSLVGQRINPLVLPGFLTALCMLIAFSTGTSWGTFAVVFPLAMPLAYAVNPDPVYVQLCFGAVLGGAVFGDQCSPISDTTILSSMFTGCDLMDHVKTQLPLALAVSGLGIVVATTLAAFI